MVLGKLSAMEDHLKEMTRQAEEFNHHQHLYGLPVNEFSALGDIKVRTIPSSSLSLFALN